MRRRKLLAGLGGVATWPLAARAQQARKTHIIGFLHPGLRGSASAIAAVTAQCRLPGISQFRTFPEGGGLMSQGVDLAALYRRLAPFVARVLNGARPGDIPIEQPSKFELAINLKTARMLGLTGASTFLASADVSAGEKIPR